MVIMITWQTFSSAAKNKDIDDDEDNFGMIILI